jgi:D-lactate dehydrogenase
MNTATRIAIFGTRTYDRQSFDAANAAHGFALQFIDAPLTALSARLAADHQVACVFVNDVVDHDVLAALGQAGVRLLALRCAGYNNVDLVAAEALGIDVVRVPAYSPHAVSEFTIGLLLSLDRKIHRAWARVRENNFALDGLVGRNLHGRVAGIVGTGEIGALVARALRAGFGCDVLASDPVVNQELVDIGVRYVERDVLLREADIVSLHCPLTPDTRHLIDALVLAAAKPSLVIVNTSRGALIDTSALIDALKQRQVAGVALDVYEQEAGIFFDDLSNEIIDDDVLQRLLTFPNVLMTGHQAFLTEEALAAIAQTTLQSVADYAAGRPLPNRVISAHAGKFKQ